MHCVLAASSQQNPGLRQAELAQRALLCPSPQQPPLASLQGCGGPSHAGPPIFSVQAGVLARSHSQQLTFSLLATRPRKSHKILALFVYFQNYLLFQVSRGSQLPSGMPTAVTVSGHQIRDRAGGSHHACAASQGTGVGSAPARELVCTPAPLSVQTLVEESRLGGAIQEKGRPRVHTRPARKLVTASQDDLRGGGPVSSD